MASSVLDWTSTVANSGFTNPDFVAADLDGQRASNGVAGDSLRIAIDDAPADYNETNSGNTVVLSVRALEIGTVVREKQAVITLVDSSNNPIQDSGSNNITFTTELTSSNTLYNSSAFTLADNYASTAVDGWQIRCEITEGSGMPDSASVDVDYLKVTLDYDVSGAAYSITGAVAVAVTIGATMAFNQNPSIAGAVTVPITIASGLDYTFIREIAGDVTVPITVSSGMAYNRNADLTGAVTVPITIASGMVFAHAYELAGDVTVPISIDGVMDYTLNASITGAVTVPIMSRRAWTTPGTRRSRATSPSRSRLPRTSRSGGRSPEP